MKRNDLPIPDQATIRRMVGARKHPILLSSEENDEVGVNLLQCGIAGENYYHRTDNPPYLHSAPGSIAELYVRSGILERLFCVNKKLTERNMELYVFDAYRPVEVQTYFHDVWVPQYLHATHPDWSEVHVREEVSKYWASGFASKREIDPLSPPPHATGAVIDLTLRYRDTGELLDMGGDFDVVAPVSFADHLERKGDEGKLTAKEIRARDNRRVLYFAMSTEGFVVHPNEWWHFGHGDQVSAFHSGEPHAVYSTLWLHGEKP